MIPFKNVEISHLIFVLNKSKNASKNMLGNMNLSLVLNFQEILCFYNKNN